MVHAGKAFSQDVTANDQKARARASHRTNGLMIRSYHDDPPIGEDRCRSMALKMTRSAQLGWGNLVETPSTKQRAPSQYRDARAAHSKEPACAASILVDHPTRPR